MRNASSPLGESYKRLNKYTEIRELRFAPRPSTTLSPVVMQSLLQENGTSKIGFFGVSKNSDEGGDSPSKSLV